MDQSVYDTLLTLMQSELKPSLGCTEPVAICLAAARTCAMLDGEIKKLSLTLSSNLFKNAYSVKIPNSNQSGIQFVAAAGAVVREPSHGMEIFGALTPGLTQRALEFMKNVEIELLVKPDSNFYLEVRAETESETAETLTVTSHTNLVRERKNGATISDSFDEEAYESSQEQHNPIKDFRISDFVEACESIPIEQLDFLKEAIEMNKRVSADGLKAGLGMASGGKIASLIENGLLTEDLLTNVRMRVTGACDMRMGGGDATTMTLVGSGNQGIQAIVTVVAAGEYLGFSEEKIRRAVMLSILGTIYAKSYVGRLSPICGAILSGAAASGAICWMMGGNPSQIENSMQNVFGNLSGMICDGAKDGCALKLGSCATEAVVSAQMAMGMIGIKPTDGIISTSVEDTIRNISRLSHEGMADADMNIIDIMLKKNNAGV